MERAISALGLVVFIGLAYLFSVNRRAVRWRTVAWGLGLQVLLAVIVIRTAWGFAAFDFLGGLARKFLDFSDAGASFVFGEKFTDHYFAFKVLPTIIFVSAITTVLYYFGVLQRIVQGIAWVMVKTMGTSGAESLCDANVFVGQTEAPLLIRPYLATLTQSELHAIMVGGFSHIAAGVMVAYISFGAPAVHLIAASVMAAPGALALSKLLFPEDGEPETRGTVRARVERPWINPVDAAASGAADGARLCINVAAMLIAFLALLALVNAVLGWGGGRFGMPQLSLEWLFARLLAPVAWLIGVPWAECGSVGVLLGKKTVLNEFIAYLDLKTLLDNAKAVASGAATAAGLPTLSPRAVVLSTYALCGFSNISSIAIQIGGIGGLAPTRQHDLAKLGVRALVAGALTNFVNACIAGVLL
ncbi:MAG TPA: NupC/NupG family nucleoside CNT transporter [Thermoanaerobaculaceae bacterium]|nr:NupC/NupG family nucleoside CNT transporter [Thermoanaerobaculaceae bacterium]